MSRSRDGVAILAFGAALAIGAPAPGDDDAAPIVLADFEGGDKSLKVIKANLSAIELVEPSPGQGGHALHWTVSASTGVAPYIHIHLPKAPDLSKNRIVQFRIRLDGARPGPLFLRLETQTGALIGARVRGVSSEWKTMGIDIDSMETTGAFDPTAVRTVAFAINGSAGGSYVIDDVVLVASMPAPEAKDPPAADAKNKNARRFAADFEAEESIEFVDAIGAKVQRAPAGPKEKGFVLACTADAAGKESYVRLFGVPADIRECGTLRFRVRASKPVKQTLIVHFETGVEDYVGAKVTGISTQWKTVELRVPEMVEFQDFDPRRVQAMSFTFGEAPDAVVQIDDVEIEKTAGGWRSSEPELIARVFGDARAKKVAKNTTPHFDVFSENGAADDKFVKALEDEYEFVKKTLSLREMDERLPVYILANSTLYQDFLVRFAGSTKASAEASAGRGCPRYFATFFQQPDAPVVVHELTHGLFQRTVGVSGGSWFQEGVAVYVEHLFRHESAASSFAANLRSGQFVHLADLMKIPKLIAEHDAKGTRTPERLYLQAGAFYEFLARGPMSDKAPTLIATLARSRATADETPARVAAVLGSSLDDVEKAWIAWGSEPPKEK